MANIADPNLIDQPSLGGGGLVRPAAARRPADAAAAGLENIVDFYVELEQTQQEFRRKTMGARAKALFTEQIIEKRMEMANDADPATRTERFTEYAENLRQSMADQIDDNAVRELFEIEASELSNAHRLTVFQAARRQEIDTQKSDLLDNLRIFSNAADDAEIEGNLLARDFAVDDGLAAIDTAPFLDDLERGNLRRGFLEEIDSRRVLRLVRSAVADPDFSIEELSTGLAAAKDALDSSENLSLAERERLETRIDNTMRTGLNDLDVRARRQEIEEDRAQRDYEEKVAKDAYSRIDLPPNDPTRLTIEDLESIKPDLTFSDYRTIKLALDKAALVEDSTHVVVAVRSALSDPGISYDEKRRMINSAFSNGVLGLPGITRETWDKLSGINESMNRPDPGITTPYRRWSLALEAAFETNPRYQPAEEIRDLKSRLQLAMDEYDRFARENPYATSAEHQGMVAQIAAAFAPDDSYVMPYNEGVLPLPFGYEGARNMVTDETLDLSAVRIEEAARQGLLTSSERDFQVRMNDRWGWYLQRDSKMRMLMGKEARGAAKP